MEKEKGTFGASSSLGVSTQADVEAMMAKLGLKEDDLDNVVFEEENMRSAWDLAKDVKIRAIEDNLFTLRFACLGDWEKVMDGGPWVFREKSVLITPYDGYTKPSTIDLNTILMWIQIHDLPDGYKVLLKSLACKVGEFVAMEPHSSENVGNFYRVRVRIDVRKQLKAAVSIIRDGQRVLFLVKYERIPDWCAVCGMLGHLYKEHGDGIHDESTLFFKDLKADYVWRPSSHPGRGRGRGGSFGSFGPGRGGRGRGTDSSLVNFVEENTKDSDMDDAELNRKRGAAGVAGSGGPASGTVASIAGALEKSESINNGPPSPPVKRDPKRSKMGDVGEENSANANLISATSGTGVDRTQ
ncbi:hypothetical protein ACQ4PT_024803 [Festuca glaucescens]